MLPGLSCRLKEANRNAEEPRKL